MARYTVPGTREPLIRTNPQAADLAEAVRGAEAYIAGHGLPEPRSTRRTLPPMKEYVVFLPNRSGYEKVAARYAFAYPESFLIMDGDRFAVLTHNHSDLAAITGVLHLGKGGRLCKTDGRNKTLDDYLADGMDVVEILPPDAEPRYPRNLFPLM